MALIGTEEDENMPTSSSSPNARAGGGYQGGVPGVGFIGGGAQGATTAVGPTNSSAGQGGGGAYANLSQYLQANQGTGATTAKAGANLVNKSSADVDSAQGQYAKDAGAEITGQASGTAPVQGNFDKINAGAVGVDQNILGQINSGKYTGPKDFSQVKYSGPAIADITAKYTGGSTADNLNSSGVQADRSAMAQASGTNADLVKQASGGQDQVAGLLKGAYGNTTTGENQLDSFLARGTDQGRTALADSARNANRFQGAYQGIQDRLNGQIKDANQTAAATNASYGSAIGKAQGTTDATKKTYTDALAAYKPPAPPPPAPLPTPAVVASAPPAESAKPSLGNNPTYVPNAAQGESARDHVTLPVSYSNTPVTIQSGIPESVARNTPLPPYVAPAPEPEEVDVPEPEPVRPSPPEYDYGRGSEGGGYESGGEYDSGDEGEGDDGGGDDVRFSTSSHRNYAFKGGKVPSYSKLRERLGKGC